MTDPSQIHVPQIIQPADIGARRFAHQAMNTEFEIFCVHADSDADSDYAQQACWAAFDLLDRLENELSRFIPNSDISRINHLAAGETIRVSRWTMECLELARQAYAETGGAFDISLGTGFESLELSPRDCLVTAGGLKPTPPRSGSRWGGLQPATGVCTSNTVQLDLGGIGKGYALDRMAEVLAEWDIHQALLHGGHSSVLALDAPIGLDGWPLTMGERTVAAKGRAYSASGIRSQGAHIVDPRTSRPASRRVAAWVSLEVDGRPSPGAVAETYSTAFMILPAAEVDAIRARHPGLEAWFLDEGKILSHG